MLDDLANFKAAAAVLYWSHREWEAQSGLGPGHSEKVRGLITELVDDFIKVGGEEEERGEEVSSCHPSSHFLPRA